MGNGKLEIGDTSIPVYNDCEVEINRKEIEKLSELPYQGKVFPHIISIEEIQRKEERND